MTDFFSLARWWRNVVHTHTQFEVSSQMWSVQSLQPGDTLFSLFIPLFNCLCRCPLKLSYPFLLLFFLLDFISFSGSRVEVSLRSEYVKLRWAWITAGLPGIVWWPHRVEFWVCFLNCFFLFFSLHWSRETDRCSFSFSCLSLPSSHTVSIQSSAWENERLSSVGVQFAVVCSPFLSFHFTDCVTSLFRFKEILLYFFLEKREISFKLVSLSSFSRISAPYYY